MEIPQVVHDYVDAFARADVDGCVGAFAADGTYSDPGTGGPLSGQALRDHFAAFFGGFPDARCQTVSLDPVTEHLSVWRWLLRGTNTGSYRGAPATGRSLTLPAANSSKPAAASCTRSTAISTGSPYWPSWGWPRARQAPAAG